MNKALEEQMGDPEFQKILAESEPVFKDAENWYRWDPEVGEHIVQIASVDQDYFEDERTGKKSIRATVDCTIDYGEDEGNTFRLGRWSARNYQGLKTLASVLAEQPLNGLAECLDVLLNNVGTRLKIRTTLSRTKGYKNHMPLARVEQIPFSRPPANEAAAGETTTAVANETN